MYATLRARAIQEGDLMAQCYRQSQEAYQRGDRALAKRLSEEGRVHKQEMENLNTSASAWIFRGEHHVPRTRWTYGSSKGIS